jgi:hypothetical protein
MEGDNAYLCEELGRRVPALKRACIKSLPHTLVIHLKRFEFDYHSQTRFKVRDRFEFPQELDLFPYTADGLAAAEQEAAAAAAAGDDAAAAGEDGGDDDGGARLARQSSGAGGAAAASSPGAGPRPEYVYDLAGVVVHSGSAFTGHYYSFARERTALADPLLRRRGAGWYCFDDKSVRPWEVHNLECDCYGGYASQDYNSKGYRPPRNEIERPHSAYMLFYERRCQGDANTAALFASSGSSAPQQQQAAPAAAGEAAAAAAPPTDPDSAGGAAGFVAPWGMPLSLYREVMTVNIAIMQQLHTLDREFFRFVRLLVENRGDVGGQLSQRKARRRELPPPLQPPPTAATAAAAAGSGGSCSAMSCDPAATCGMAGSGGAAPTPDGGSSAAAGGGAAAGFEQLPSPGPSSRRGEEGEQVAVLLTQLSLRFQMQLYQRAAGGLRTDSAVWAEALKSLLNVGPAAPACQLAALELLQREPSWLDALLVRAPDPLVRDFGADVVGFLLVHAAPRSNLHAALTAHLAAGPDPPPPMPPLPAVLVSVVFHLVQLLVTAVAAAAGHADLDDQYGVAAVAAVLRDYMCAAPPVHGVLLLSRHDLMLSLIEHLASMYAGLPDTVEELREEGPAVVRLLYALVSRANNLERLTSELDPQTAGGSGRREGGGAANPFAAAGRGAVGGIEPALQPHAFKRLNDVDVLAALCHPLVLVAHDTAALLQLLMWENTSASQIVAPRLVQAAMLLVPAQVFNLMPHLVNPIRDALGIRDNLMLLRAFSALFTCVPGGPLPLLHSLLEGCNTGWVALRKMMMLACVEGVVRGLHQSQVNHIMQVGLPQLRNLGGANALMQELVALEAELARLEASEQSGPVALIRLHIGAVTYMREKMTYQVEVHRALLQDQMQRHLLQQVALQQAQQQHAPDQEQQELEVEAIEEPDGEVVEIDESFDESQE